MENLVTTGRCLFIFFFSKSPICWRFIC